MLTYRRARKRYIANLAEILVYCTDILLLVKRYNVLKVVRVDCWSRHFIHIVQQVARQVLTREDTSARCSSSSNSLSKSPKEFSCDVQVIFIGVVKLHVVLRKRGDWELL